MQDSKIYGVEIDKISAGIAQQLYQKTSIAALAFEEANIPDSFFDAVIGNVPFGDIINRFFAKYKAADNIKEWIGAEQMEATYGMSKDCLLYTSRCV